jgi:prepilin-type N-terminal cleavage/methylation domain-containing protein
MKRSGFTLIELIVVLIIATVMGAVAVPSVLDQRKTTTMNNMQSDVNSMKVTLDKASLHNSGSVAGLKVSRKALDSDVMQVTSSTGEVLASMTLADSNDAVAVTIPTTSDTYTINVTNPSLEDNPISYSSSSR